MGPILTALTERLASVCLVASVCFGVGGTANAGAVASQEPATTRVLPNSVSVILKAAHIVVVTVLNAQAGPEIRLKLALADTLKGLPVGAPGTQFQVAGQGAPPGRREAAPQGPWAAVDHRAGARLVVFSSATDSTPAAVFNEATVLRVLSATPAESEVRRALAMERSGGPLSSRLDTMTEPPPLSALFGEYVVARLGEETLYGDPIGFDTVMTWFENPGRSRSLQLFVLQTLTGRLLLTEPNPVGFTERLALAAFRILADTADRVLAGQIADTYLPNLLGLQSMTPHKTVEAVFRGDTRTLARARGVLEQRPAGGARDRLLAWLSR